uniref:CUB domain-containing protein n=1 Tax=Caenorhabditis japonica TaxID=281687 RepID=A0A8R1DIF6_CAEJA
MDEDESANDTPILLSTLNSTTPMSTIPITTKDYCYCDMEIYGPEDISGVLKSPNFPKAHCGSACTCSPEDIHVEVDDPVAITSPNYPEMYCPNLVCRHTFYAPQGYYLQIYLDYAELEKFHDYLKIYDGNCTKDPLITKITGLKVNEDYNSTGGTVFIVFQSDESVGGRGFHANIVALCISICTIGISSRYHNMFNEDKDQLLGAMHRLSAEGPPEEFLEDTMIEVTDINDKADDVTGNELFLKVMPKRFDVAPSEFDFEGQVQELGEEEIEVEVDGEENE